MTSRSRPSLNTVLDDLAHHLEFEISEGTSEVEFSSNPLAGLATASRKAPARDPGRTRPPPAPPARPTPTPQSDASALDRIAARIADCRKCPLHKGRTKTVPGQGSPAPEILFVGEGPGADEDIQGLAFVGAAGRLLTKMIEAMGFRREDVFIANIVKCRPPENRKPLPEEMDACLPYLREQIALLNPKVIIALGATAVQGLLGIQTGITRLRGNWQTFGDFPVMPTFHPSYLLRAPSGKKDVWEDLKAVLTHLGRPVPEIQKKR